MLALLPAVPVPSAAPGTMPQDTAALGTNGAGAAVNCPGLSLGQGNNNRLSFAQGLQGLLMLAQNFADQTDLPTPNTMAAAPQLPTSPASAPEGFGLPAWILTALQNPAAPACPVPSQSPVPDEKKKDKGNGQDLSFGIAQTPVASAPNPEVPPTLAPAIANTCHALSLPPDGCANAVMATMENQTPLADSIGATSAPANLSEAEPSKTMPVLGGQTIQTKAVLPAAVTQDAADGIEFARVASPVAVPNAKADEVLGPQDGVVTPANAGQMLLQSRSILSVSTANLESPPEPDKKSIAVNTEGPKEPVFRALDSLKTEAPAAQPRAAVSDQIKDAILARTEELRQSGQTEIHLQLQPPDLGPVRIHLSMGADQVHARVVVQEEAARQALENQTAALRDRLSEAGITLGQFNVTRDGTGWQFQQGPDQQSELQLSPPPSVAKSVMPAPTEPDRVMTAQRSIDVLA